MTRATPVTPPPPPAPPGPTPPGGYAHFEAPYESPPFPQPTVDSEVKRAKRGGLYGLAKSNINNGETVPWSSLFVSPGVNGTSGTLVDLYGSKVVTTRFGGLVAVSAQIIDLFGYSQLGAVFVYQSPIGGVDPSAVSSATPQHVLRLRLTAPDPDKFSDMQYGRSVALHASGKWLAVGTDRPINIHGERGKVWVYTSVYDGDGKLIDMSLQSTLQANLALELGSEEGMAFSPDGRLLAVGVNNADNPAAQCPGSSTSGAVVVFWRPDVGQPFDSTRFHVLSPCMDGSGVNYDTALFGQSLRFNSGFSLDYMFTDEAGTEPRFPPAEDPMLGASGPIATNAKEGLGGNLFLAVAAPGACNSSCVPHTQEGRTLVFALGRNGDVSQASYFTYAATLAIGNGTEGGVTTWVGNECGRGLATSDDRIWVGCPGYSRFKSRGQVFEYVVNGPTTYTHAGTTQVFGGAQTFESWSLVQVFEEPLSPSSPVLQRTTGSRFGERLAYAEAFGMLVSGQPSYPSGGSMGMAVLMRRKAGSDEWLHVGAIIPNNFDGSSKMGDSLAAAGGMIVAGASGFDEFLGAMVTATCQPGYAGSFCAEPICPDACVNGDCIATGTCECTTRAWTGPRCNSSLGLGDVEVLATERTSILVRVPLPLALSEVDLTTYPVHVALFVNGNVYVVTQSALVNVTGLTPGAAVSFQAVAGLADSYESPELFGTPTLPLTVFTACPLGTVEADDSTREARLCSACLAGTYVSAGESVCTSCPTNTQSAAGAGSIELCTCLRGTYPPTPGARGVACVACPSGGICDGGVDGPRPQPGFWQLSYDTFVACDPPSSCTGSTAGTGNATTTTDGGNNCATGYSGYLCRTCTEDYYYDGRACVACPSGSPALFAMYVVLVVVLALVVLAIAIYGSQASAFSGTGGETQSRLGNFNFVHISTAVATLQIATLVLDMKFEWPSSTNNLASVLASGLLLSSDTFTAGCTVTSFALQYLTGIAVPLLVVAVFVVVYLVMRALPTSQEYSPLLLARAAVIMTPILYLPSARAALTMFDCSKLPDGKYYLDVSRSTECFTSDWWQLFPVGLLSTVAYVGAPLVLTVVLSRARHDLDNPRVVALYGSLYSRFKPQYFFWELGLLGRRFVVLVVATFITQHPFHQLVLLMGIFLGSTMATSRSSPYRSVKHNAFVLGSDVMLMALVLAGSLFYSTRIPASSTGYAEGLLWIILVCIIVLAVGGAVVELVELVSRWRSGKLDQRSTFYALDDADFVVEGGGGGVRHSAVLNDDIDVAMEDI